MTAIPRQPLATSQIRGPYVYVLLRGAYRYVIRWNHSPDLKFLEEGYVGGLALTTDTVPNEHARTVREHEGHRVRWPGKPQGSPASSRNTVVAIAVQLVSNMYLSTVIDICAVTLTYDAVVTLSSTRLRLVQR